MRRKALFLTLILIMFGCRTLVSHTSDPQSLQRTPFDKQPDDGSLVSGWYFVSDTATGYVRALDAQGNLHYINPKPIVTAGNIIEVEVRKIRIARDYFLFMQLDALGERRFAWATEQSVGRQLAFVLRDTLRFVPVVQSEITSGQTAMHHGHGTKAELSYYERIVRDEMRNVPPFFKP